MKKRIPATIPPHWVAGLLGLSHRDFTAPSTYTYTAPPIPTTTYTPPTEEELEQRRKREQRELRDHKLRKLKELSDSNKLFDLHHSYSPCPKCGSVEVKRKCCMIEESTWVSGTSPFYTPRIITLLLFELLECRCAECTHFRGHEKPLDFVDPLDEERQERTERIIESASEEESE